MANFVANDYKGNQIFRGQPNHLYFDKPFNDDEDCLFQTLHEIDPHFLKEEQKADTINFLNTIIIDPRTKLSITKMCYDYTKEEKTVLFISPKKSFLKVEDHELGVRVLNLMQHGLVVEEEDMYNFYRLQNLRLKEKEFFEKYVSEYCQNNKELLYAPCRKLLEMYQKWYNCKSTRLTKRYLHETYNTHLGLPHVRQCKNVLNDKQFQINSEIIINVGENCLWQNIIKEEFKTLNHSLKSYAEIYENSEEQKETLEKDLKQQFEKIIEQEAPEMPCLYIPLESLLFLVTAGDYIDLPTEMLLNIEEIGSRKYIAMDIPLPSRQVGWHAYEEVVERAVTAMLSIKQIKNLENDISEINASMKHPNCFKSFTLQDFMENTKLKADNNCKFSKTLTKWQLSATEDDINFQIYTSLDLFQGNKSVAIKLEYKPQFGCENLTKYKILKEWFKLKLIGAKECTCLRLDATNYQPLLEQLLHTSKLEEYLISIYQVKCDELLNNLSEFLKMLYGMPLGHYMLRYNSKFKDKLLLCKPSQEIAQNTVYLHKLINDEVTDMEFMAQQNYQSIDANLCNLMHMQHKILPAAFSPFVKAKKCSTLDFCLKQTKKVAQTRNNTKKHFQHNKSQRTQNHTEYKKPANRSRTKRANRKRRQFEALKAKCNELNDINQDIELDRLMLNNL